MAVIIERVTRANKVLSFAKFNSDKIRLGRAYDNDVVLQDEHVDPYHAELELRPDSSMMLLTDLGSINGIKTGRGDKVKFKTAVQSGQSFTLGKSHIRILSSQHSVAPAKPMSALDDIAARLNQWYFAAIALVAFWATMMMHAWLSRFDFVIWSKEAAKYALFSLALVLVPTLIALSARFFKKEVRFFAALVFSFSIFVLLQLSTFLTNWLFFNWPEANLTIFANEAVEVGLLVMLFWGAFYLASNMSMKTISAVSVCLVTAIWGLSFYSKQGNEIKLYPSTFVVVMPTQVLLAKANSVPSNGEVTSALFDRAKLEAKRLNKENNDN